MRTKAIAALVIPLVLAGVTVALAQEQSLIFQYSGVLQCPGIDDCERIMIYEGDLQIYRQFPDREENPTACICRYFMYTADPDPDADSIGVEYEFSAEENVCARIEVFRPRDSVSFLLFCGSGAPKDCGGDADLCAWWCGGTCWTIVGFSPIVMSPTAVVIQVNNRNSQITGSIDISVSVFALLNPPPSPTPTPQVIPQLNPEYFNPFPYPRDAPSPLRGVRIDFTFVARSIVTVLNMLSEGGYLTWIAAFAVIFIILLSFINYILKRISGGGG